MTRSPSMADVFDPRRNSLNAIRLALALLVIVSHVWPLGGYGSDPGSGPDGSNLGAWCVAGFFGISGYLITASRVHSRSLVDYLWRRLLRIYPAFLVALVVTGFVFAPISARLDGTGAWSPLAAAKYVVHGLGIYLLSYAPEGSLSAVPQMGSWVGTLWTLAYEFACYLIIGLLVTVIGSTRARTVLVAAWFVLSMAGTVAHRVLDTNPHSITTQMLRLGSFFAAGALIYLLRNRVPATMPLAVLAGALVVAMIPLELFQVLGGLPVAYLMLYLGARLPLHRIGARNDVSYGIYIYGWPVLQLLVVVFGVATLPLPLFLALAILVTVPLAWASWLLVERPAMRLKRLTARVRPDREGHVVAQQELRTAA